MKSKLDLKELEGKLNDHLNSETTETMSDWLNDKRESSLKELDSMCDFLEGNVKMYVDGSDTENDSSTTQLLKNKDGKIIVCGMVGSSGNLIRRDVLKYIGHNNVIFAQSPTKLEDEYPKSHLEEIPNYDVSFLDLKPIASPTEFEVSKYPLNKYEEPKKKERKQSNSQRHVKGKRKNKRY